MAQLTVRVDTLLTTVAALQREEDDPGGSPREMPGLKPVTGMERPPRQPRKRWRHAFVRQRAEPTDRITHAVDTCPTCGRALTGGSVKRTREVIEVPLGPAVVTEHVYLERLCLHCRTRHTPVVDLVGQVVGK